MDNYKTLQSRRRKEAELKAIKRAIAFGKPNPKHYDDFQQYLDDLAEYQRVEKAPIY